MSVGDQRRLVQEADIVFGNIPAEWVLTSGRLRWLQLATTGFEDYSGRLTGATKGLLLVTNMSGLYNTPVAETVLAGVLALTRDLPALLKFQEARLWSRWDIRSRARLLRGSRVTVLGAGMLGEKIRSLFEATGCVVESFARTSARAELHQLGELDSALGRADVVVSCLPETPLTRGLFDRRRLELLKPSAIFVNVGRGSLLDEATLVAMLRDKRLFGCVVDVTSVEPLPPESPLWDTPGLILTQHTAGGWQDEPTEKARLFADNLRRYVAGQPLLNIVDTTRGY